MINPRKLLEISGRFLVVTTLCFLSVAPTSASAKESPDFIVANSSDNSISVFINDLKSGGDIQQITPDFSAGNTPAFVGVGYFNGDRLPDLVVVNPDVPQLVFFLGEKKGLFEVVPGTYTFDVALGPNVAVGDYNNDGYDDVVVPLQDGTVDVLLGDGQLADNAQDHFVGLPSRIFIGSRANAVASADFNEDDSLDAVVCDYAANVAVVLTGDGSGNLSPVQSLSTGDLPESVAIADFNRDGHADFAVAGGTSQYASVYLGNGDGSFQAEIQILTRNGGDGTYAIAAGDLNNDGYDDVVTRGGPDSLGQAILTVQLWDSAASNFVPGGSVSTGAWLSGLSVNDLNGDGNQDVVFTNAPVNNSFFIYYGDGEGNLVLGVPPVSTGNLPGALTVINLPNIMWKNIK